MSIIGTLSDGYYDDEGMWQRTKFCFVYCRERCTCQPPMGAHYNPDFDKRIDKAEALRDERREEGLSDLGKIRHV